MPRLSHLIDDLAERFSFEHTKLNTLARALRQNGLLSSGARGLNAPPATSVDAARLLIAMMLDSKMATAAQDVILVGDFLPLNPEALTPAFRPETLQMGLAQLIGYAGTAPDDHLEDLTALTFSLTPYAALGEIWIRYEREAADGEPADEEGMIVKETQIAFTHATVRDINEPLPASYIAAARRFPTGFYQRPEIRKHDLIAIGKLVMGSDQ